MSHIVPFQQFYNISFFQNESQCAFICTVWTFNLPLQFILCLYTMSLTILFVPTPLESLVSQISLTIYFPILQDFHLITLSFTNCLYLCVHIYVFIRQRPSRFNHSAPTTLTFFSIIFIFIYFYLVPFQAIQYLQPFLVYTFTVFCYIFS